MTTKFTLPLAAIMVLLVTTEGISGKRARQRRACRRARVQCYQPSVQSPCQPKALCSCPYYDFGDYWYGEEFDTPTSCLDGQPVAVFASSGPEYCDPTGCGCFARKRMPENLTCDDLYQDELVPHAENLDLTAQPEVTQLAGPLHLEIGSIDGTPVSSPRYVSYFKLKVVNPHLQGPGRIITFWVGHECTNPNVSRPPVNVTRVVTGCDAIVRLASGGSGNTRDMIINLTQ